MLSGKDIIGIIRAGKAAKVSVLELNGLKIIYQGKAAEAPVSSYFPIKPADQESLPELPSIPDSSPIADLDELVFTDPLEFEAQAIKREKE